MNESTEAPNATLSEQLTCKTIRRKRRLDEIDDDDLDKRSDLEPAVRRRRILTPKKSIKNKSTNDSRRKSNDVKQFELAIATGQWRNVLGAYGPALKRNTTILEDVDLNMYDSYGLTSLHAAIILHDIELVLLLLKQGARYDIANLAGWTTFHLAAGNPRMVFAILDFISPKKS